MLIGAHVSIEGGYANALTKLQNMGGNCLQIFSVSPRGWNFAKFNEFEIQKFISLKKEMNIDPIFFHSSYLINLADDSKIGHLSKLSLISELSIAAKLHIKGSIVHLGSYKKQITINKYETLITHIKEILDQTPRESLFIIENAGNKKIGQSLEEIAQIIKDVNDSRINVCLDTCHLHSGGYDLSTTEKLDSFLIKFNSLIGLNKLAVFHFNDSKDPFNSGRDRHENLGKGTIRLHEFQLLLNHQSTKHLPFIIETPGFDKKGPDKKNLDILKNLEV